MSVNVWGCTCKQVYSKPKSRPQNHEKKTMFAYAIGQLSISVYSSIKRSNIVVLSVYKVSDALNFGEYFQKAQEIVTR